MEGHIVTTKETERIIHISDCVSEWFKLHYKRQLAKIRHVFLLKPWIIQPFY